MFVVIIEVSVAVEKSWESGIRVVAGFGGLGSFFNKGIFESEVGGRVGVSRLRS